MRKIGFGGEEDEDSEEKSEDEMVCHDILDDLHDEFLKEVMSGEVKYKIEYLKLED